MPAMLNDVGKTAPAIEEILDRFEEQWALGTPPSISAFRGQLPEGAEHERLCLLHELVAIDLWQRWTTDSRCPASFGDGETVVHPGELPSWPTLDDYTVVFPEMGPLDELPKLLVREEYRARRLRGARVVLPEYLRRFGGGDELQRILAEVDRELAGKTTAAPGRFETFASLNQFKSTDEADGLLSGHVIDQFELVRPLGSGAFGTVWAANDRELGREVALKIPRRANLGKEEIEFFLREARSAAKVSHPHIVAVHQVGVADAVPYIVSDLVRGTALSDEILQRSFSPREAAELCVTAAESLHHAHEAGLVHRDIKPANVILDSDGKPHLTDFGLARWQDADATIASDGQVIGTPAYMSPEQAQGESHRADRRADVYSLGVILYELLTQERPFRGNANMIMQQIMQDDPPSPRKLVGSVPRDLETITLKCLMKNPASRYQTAAALADDLRRYLRGAPIAARPLGPIERTWKLCRAHPTAATFVVGTVLGLAMIVAGLVGWIRHSSQLNSTLAVEYGNLADRDWSLGQFAEVHAQLQRKANSLERVRPAPEEALARTYAQLGYASSLLGQQNDAVARLNQAHSLQTKMRKQRPHDRGLARELWETVLHRGNAFLQRGNIESALTDFRTAVRLAEANCNDSSRDATCLADLRDSYENLATALLHDYEVNEAQELYQKSMDLAREVVASDRAGVDGKRALATIHDSRGMMRLGLHDVDAACEQFQAALKIRREVADAMPAAILVQVDLLTSFGYLATAEEARYDFPAAIEWYKRANDLWTRHNHQGRLQQQPRMMNYFRMVKRQQADCELKQRAAENLDAVLAEHPNHRAELIQAAALSFGRGGNIAEARSAAERLAMHGTEHPAALDYAAFTFAQLARLARRPYERDDAAGDASQIRELTDRAMALLEQAADSNAYGAKRATQYLKYSQGFELLRDRKEFQQLIARLESVTRPPWVADNSGPRLGTPGTQFGF